MGRNTDDLVQRKNDHINICCDEALPVEGASTYLEHVSFLHHSLPEIDYNTISTSTSFLAHELSAPFMISCMTGGSAEGYTLNKLLAMAAEREGLAVGTGSLRILMRKPEVMEHFRLKKLAPSVPVVGNLGAVQLPEFFDNNAAALKQFLSILDDLELDALAVHLNPGQEIFQQNGDRNFSGLLERISRLCDISRLPIIVKETGAGITPWEAEQLFRAGVKYVDVAGSGGTNWIAVEAMRGQQDDLHSGDFQYWGIPTALALSAIVSSCRKFIPEDGGIIASGGLRDAADFSKSIALGADIAASALPFIRLARKTGLEGCIQYIQKLKLNFRRHMLLSSSPDIPALQQAPILFSKQFNYRLRELERAAYEAGRRLTQRNNKRHNSGQAAPLNNNESDDDKIDGEEIPAAGSSLRNRAFRKHSIHQRRERMAADPFFASKEKAGELAASGHRHHLLDLADAMIESAIGFMPVPLGLVQNCLIDGEHRNLPMAGEEPSVLAAANYAMRLIAHHGGCETSSTESIMKACVYLSLDETLGQQPGNHQDMKNQHGAADVADDAGAHGAADVAGDAGAHGNTGAHGAEPEIITKIRSRIKHREHDIHHVLADILTGMESRGGGYRGMSSAWLSDSQSLRVTLIVDVCDAMGANILNTAAEAVSPLLEEITGGKKLMAILSNQAEERRASASITIPLSALHRGGYTGRELGERIVRICRIANEDPSRAVTHNKGIMNGITGLALASGNDTRAVEASAHAWAARSGTYRSLSSWRIEADTLRGSLELPLALATVGGAVSCHPAAQLSLTIMDNPDARTLARYAAALGLAQNFA
ncbi:MAG: type 2 isopentenyl-diphosphate Delta-isomerase, partial [Salinispira sp.]